MNAETEREKPAVDSSRYDVETMVSDAAPDDSPKEDVIGDTLAEPEATDHIDVVGPDDERDREVADMRDQLLRMQADFDNFRRRTRQEREDLQQFATRKLLSELLPVVDNFERALASFGDAANLTEVKTGVEMVYRQLMTILESSGVAPIETVGQSFDPNLHQAVMQEPAEDRETNVVIQEFQKGYTIHGKLLRPAMVKVTV